jgi:hypothetical protein
MMTKRPTSKPARRPLPPAPPDGFDRLLTIPAVQEILRCSRQSVYRLYEAEQLQLVRLGGMTRVTETSLRKLMGDLPRAEYRHIYTRRKPKT